MPAGIEINNLYQYILIQFNNPEGYQILKTQLRR